MYLVTPQKTRILTYCTAGAW